METLQKIKNYIDKNIISIACISFFVMFCVLAVGSSYLQSMLYQAEVQIVNTNDSLSTVVLTRHRIGGNWYGPKGEIYGSEVPSPKKLSIYRL
jgi:hypothetical protein